MSKHTFNPAVSEITGLGKRCRDCGEIESAHGEISPGSWQANEWGSGWEVSATNHTVCRLADCNKAANNAHLIAAAPELLAALENLQIAANESISCSSRRPNETTEGYLIRRFAVLAQRESEARAAIAKARGL